MDILKNSKNEKSEVFFLRTFVYLFIFFYIIVNNTFSKVCIILGSSLDSALSLPAGANNTTVALSTALGAFAKFIGIFISGSKRKIIVWSFFFNGLMLFLCISTKSILIFYLARTFQGFFAGIQNSVLFGLLGTLQNCKDGFRNFNTISGLVCCFTGIMLYFLNSVSIIYGLIGINVFAGFLFLNLPGVKDSKFSMSQIDWLVIKRLSRNKLFFIKTAFLGFFLGCTLLAMGQQKQIIAKVFNIKFEGLINALCSITFLSSSVISYLGSFHSLNLFNILNFSCLFCVFLGLATKSIYIFLTGIFLPMSCFAIISPRIMEELTLSSSNRFVAAAFASCVRSFFTALTMYVVPKFIPNPILHYTVILLFFSGFFYTFIFYKEEK